MWVFLRSYTNTNHRFWSRSPLPHLQNPSRKDLNVQMMMEIDSSLQSAEIIRTPCVYIRPEVDKSTANKVKDIVVNHQGEICGKNYYNKSCKL